MQQSRNMKFLLNSSFKFDATGHYLVIRMEFTNSLEGNRNSSYEKTENLSKMDTRLWTLFIGHLGVHNREAVLYNVSDSGVCYFCRLLTT